MKDLDQYDRSSYEAAYLIHPNSSHGVEYYSQAYSATTRTHIFLSRQKANPTPTQKSQSTFLQANAYIHPL